MRFISVRDLRTKSAEIWRDLDGEREMVVTSNGRPVAILAAVDEASLEASLRAFVALAPSMRSTACSVAPWSAGPTR